MTTAKTLTQSSSRARLKNSAVTVVLIILTCVFLWSSLGLSRLSAWIPQLVLATTLLVLLFQLAHEIRSSKQSEMTGDGAGLAAVLQVMAWIALMLVLVWLTGVSIGAALFCLLYMRFYAGEQWWISAGLAVVLGAGVQLFFGSLMQVPLYQGIVLPILMST